MENKSIIFFNKENFQLSGIRTPNLILAYCTNVSVSNCQITGGYLYLASTKNSTIRNNLITENAIGILIRWQSTHNMIQHNTFHTNRKGITIVDSTASHNIITKNSFKHNSYGVTIESNVENLVYHNNFINNTVHATCYGFTSFNSSRIGNYWDDYNRTDVDGDGIGETPYEIPRWRGAVDYLPAIQPLTLNKCNN